MVVSTYALLCRYRYDPLDRLTSSEQVNQPPILSFYQKSRLAAEVAGDIRRTFFQYEDVLLAQQQATSTIIEKLLLATDKERSVLQCEHSGGRESLVYAPYGYLGVNHSSTSVLKFNGERLGDATEHYLLGNGYRAFNPVLMRFNRPDSSSPFAEGGLNAYSYCGMDPVNNTDPTGHASGWALIASMLGRIVSLGRRASRLARLNQASASSRLVRKARTLPELTLPSGEFDKSKSFIGFHGSTREDGISLMQGLDPTFMGASGGLSGGKGFYVSLTPNIAKDFAVVAVENSPRRHPKVFAVHMSHYQARTNGRAYRFGTMGAGGLVYRHLAETEVVIQERFYRTVSIRNIRQGETLILPRAFEAPF